MVRPDSPIAPSVAATCPAGVSIQTWPVSAQGRPVKIQPRIQSDSTIRAAKPSPCRGKPGASRAASQAGAVQNSAPPAAVSTSAKGAIQP